MVDFISLSNVIYITKIVANKLATWKYTNDFEETTAASEGDGHQALAVFLGLWNRPHWVRLAGGRPGNCLAGESLWGFGTSFSLFILRGYIFRTRVRCGQEVVWPQSRTSRLFHWQWLSSLRPLGGGVVGRIIDCPNRLGLALVCWLLILWTWVDPGVHMNIDSAPYLFFVSCFNSYQQLEELVCVFDE